MHVKFRWLNQVESMHCLDFNNCTKAISEVFRDSDPASSNNIKSPKRVPNETFLKCVKALVSTHTFTSVKERSSFK